MKTFLIVIAIIFAFIILPIVFGKFCSLSKPSYVQKAQPPGFVFGIVWPILYICMAYSYYLIYTSQRSNKFKLYALILSGITLLINLFYIYITGCKNNWTYGLWTLLVYLILICVQILLAYSVVPLAGIVLAPLLGWCIFAIVMNINIVNNTK
jgi:tryptophan-rich sensory protein